MTGYIVTGIGTGIGKTFTTCALLYGAEQAGKPIMGYKPVISGWDPLEETDTTRIRDANPVLRSIDEISPWRFAAPLSPHMAAAREGMQLSVKEMTAWCHAQLSDERVSLFEGAGGVAVPLNLRETTLHWMRQLKLPVILVGGTYLGSISHTLTAIVTLKQAGITMHALVINESADAPVPFAEAKAGLDPFVTHIPLRIYQPRVSSYQAAQEIQALAQRL